MDIVDNETRSRMMAAVKGRNTRYEISIRKRLFSRGFRYRICDRKLPGRPDIVLPKHRADWLETLAPAVAISPMQMLKAKQPRQRASKTKGNANA